MKRIKLTPMESASGKCMHGVAARYVHDDLDLIIVAASKKQLRKAWKKFAGVELIEYMAGDVAVFSKHLLNKAKKTGKNASSTS